jgi:heme A synthase
MPLPPGTVDPLFMHELALELGMPVGEMCERMSAHELTVLWPAFFAWRRREHKREEETRRRR